MTEWWDDKQQSGPALFGGVDDKLVLVASLNELSEGHYLEPDERFGMGWLKACRR